MRMYACIFIKNLDIDFSNLTANINTDNIPTPRLYDFSASKHTEKPIGTIKDNSSTGFSFEMTQIFFKIGASDEVEKDIKKYVDLFDNFKLKDALKMVIEISSITNKFIQDSEIWSKN